MKRTVLLSIALVSIAVTGCSSSPKRSDGTEVIGVGNVEYNSLYHFGYNRGCSGALKQKQTNESLESMKDETLSGIDAFEDGWRSGTKTCNDGEFRSMYTVRNAQ